MEQNKLQKPNHKKRKTMQRLIKILNEIKNEHQNPPIAYEINGTNIIINSNIYIELEENGNISISYLDNINPDNWPPNLESLRFLRKIKTTTHECKNVIIKKITQK